MGTKLTDNHIVKKEFTKLEQGDYVFATNSEDSFNNINISRGETNGCDTQYFIKETTAGYLCADNYSEYKKTQKSDYVGDIRVTITIYQYVKPIPKGYILCGGDVYKEKEIVDNCEPMKNENIIYVDGEVYDGKQIQSDISPIEIIEVNGKYYSSNDIEDNCDYL